MSSHLNYFPYHRQLSHTLLDYHTFRKVIQNDAFKRKVQTMLSILQERESQGYSKSTRDHPSKKRHSCNMICLWDDSEDEGYLHFPDEDSEQQNTMEQVCNMNLRTGKTIPSRQPPHQKDRAREKVIDTEEPVSTTLPKKVSKDRTDYNVLAHLKKIPSLLTVYDALMLSPEMRTTLV